MRPGPGELGVCLPSHSLTIDCHVLIATRRCRQAVKWPRRQLERILPPGESSRPASLPQTGRFRNWPSFPVVDEKEGRPGPTAQAGRRLFKYRYGLAIKRAVRELLPVKRPSFVGSTYEVVLRVLVLVHSLPVRVLRRTITTYIHGRGDTRDGQAPKHLGRTGCGARHSSSCLPFPAPAVVIPQTREGGLSSVVSFVRSWIRRAR